jgi:hypothetical protein
MVSTKEKAEEREGTEFLELAERLATTSDPEEQRRLKEKLARLTFGQPVCVIQRRLKKSLPSP